MMLFVAAIAHVGDGVSSKQVGYAELPESFMLRVVLFAGSTERRNG